MPSLGTPELLIILMIILMLFGVGRLGKIGGELGAGIRAFRDGIKDPAKESEPSTDEPVEQPEEPLPTEETPSSDKNLE